MGLEAGEDLKGKHIDYAFIGSYTNTRIEDLWMAAKIVEGRKSLKYGGLGSAWFYSDVLTSNPRGVTSCF